MDLLRRCSRTAIAAATLIVAGCLVFQQFRGEELGPAFPHAPHGEEAGLECSACHRKAENAAEAGMPTARQCELCHAELDEGKPPEKQAAFFYEEKAVKAQRLAEVGDEVIFSHAAHAAAGVGCADCHGDVGTSERVTKSVRVSMARCIECHESKAQRRDDCATCHQEIRADVAPPSHAAGWTHLHGVASRAHGGTGAEQCQLCHTQSSCDACHLATPPADHTNFWRRRGHGVMVALDRAKCATCHQSDACDRCHQESAPVNHLAGWGSPRNRHCVSCHVQTGAQEGCATCHRGAPSHALAAPLPAGHNPGMNCRQCHGLTAPLPHPDKGDVCTACHR